MNKIAYSLLICLGVMLLSGVHQSIAALESLSFARSQMPLGEVQYQQAGRITTPGDEHWDSRFDVLGVNLYGSVRAMAVSGDDVYVGGQFSTVGNIQASNIARWDSSTGTWSAMGSGIDPYGHVNAIAVSGEYVYVGGHFLGAGGVANAIHIARWNRVTDTWSALGSGIHLYGQVYAMAVDGDDVYVGGFFTQAGDKPDTYHIARWDGSSGSWSSLGSGINLYGHVNAIAVSGDYVYVGGQFFDAGGAANTLHIARWNRSSNTWSGLGSGGHLYGQVNAIAVSGDDVYVGGLFTEAGGEPNMVHIARWDSASGTWSSLGSGINLSGHVNAIAVSGGNVYVGGQFLDAGGVTNTIHIAGWNQVTETWSNLGSGVNLYGQVYALGVGPDGLYVGGYFTSIGDKLARHFGLWHGTLADPSNPYDVYWDDRFDDLGMRYGDVLDIEDGGDYIWVGGSFTTAGGVPGTRGIARWDDENSAWSALGSGVEGYIEAIAVSGNYVYVGGSFSRIGGVLANSVARWDTATNTWSPLGSGVSGGVTGIGVSGDDVYVSGSFSSAGGNPARRVARWDTVEETWSPLGSGVGCCLTSMAVSPDGIVYVGGTLQEAGGVQVNMIARWDGDSWSDFGNGLGTSSSVVAIHLSGDEVLIGGSFNQEEGAVVDFLGMRNGDTWTQLADNPGGTILGITGSENDLYVIGFIYEIPDGTAVNQIAHWDGNSWNALGSGVSGGSPGIPYTVAKAGSDVYVGGSFNRAGDKTSVFFALWHAGTTALATGTVSGGVHAPDIVPLSVRNPDLVPLPGAHLELCPSSGGPCIWRGITDSQGNYLASNVPDGQYSLTAYPPAGSGLLPVTLGPLTVLDGQALSGQDAQLENILPLPAGTTILPASTGGFGIPRVDWFSPLVLTTQGCPGGNVTYQILRSGAILQSGPMTEHPAGQFSAAIPPLLPGYGYASVVIEIQCPGSQRANQSISFDIYIGAGNTVRTITGESLPAATVTLFTSDGVSEFVQVPDGDDIMSPANRANPDITSEDGSFGWDTVAGFYKIRAEKTGCFSPGNPDQPYVESGLLITQPPFMNLDLRLDCPGDNAHLFLPAILR